MSNDFLGQFTNQFNKLKQVIDERNKGYNTFIINLMTNIGALSLKLEKLNDSLPSYLSKYGSEIESNKKTISDLQSKLAKNQADMENNSKETSDLKNQIIELNNDKQKTTSEISNLNNTLEQLKQQNEMEKTQFQGELTEKMKSQNEQFTKELETRQQQFEEAKKTLEAEIQNKKLELDNINKESGNVKSQLQALTNENKQLKDENNRYIQSITSATASISDLLNVLQENPRDNVNFKKIQKHLNDVESYIEKISNQLQGRDIPPSNTNNVQKPPTPRVQPEQTPELNEEDFQGGRKRRRRKTRKLKKQKGGYTYGIFSNKKTHSRKGYKSKRSSKLYGGRKHY